LRILVNDVLDGLGLVPDKDFKQIILDRAAQGPKRVLDGEARALWGAGTIPQLSEFLARHDVLTCPASTYVGYVEVGHITQSHIEGAGHERGYRKSHQSADGSGAE
jgi:hypothetical protein